MMIRSPARPFWFSSLFCPSVSGILHAFPRILLLFLLFLPLSCGKSQSPASPTAVEVTAVRIEPRNIPVVFSFIGQTESSRVIEIRTRVEGIIIERKFTEGDVVKKDSLLFRIDPRPLEAKLEKAKGALAQEEASLSNARRNYERLMPLAEKNAVSKKDFDDARSSMEKADASVRAEKANVREAELNLAYTNITAPITGKTGRALKQEGSLVTTGSDSLLTSISQLDPIYVYFNISQNERLKLREEISKKTLILPRDEDIDVELVLADSKVYPVTGRMNFAETNVNTETGTLRIRAVFANPKWQIFPGEFVRVKLRGAVRPNAIVVPQRAVLQGQKGKFVYVVGSGSKAEIRQVEVGQWYEDTWIVMSGIVSGDTVIVDGALKLQEGTPVKVVSAQNANASKK